VAHDIVFADALVVDGTGAPGFRASVGVTDGRIAEITDRAPAANRVVDAAGLVLAPGFIDMHSHSDLRLLAEPDHLAKVSQGVTLEVLGQDGLSYAPVNDEVLDLLRGQLAGWNDDPPGFDWNWRTVGEYLDRLDQGIAVNAAYLVPQGTVRMRHVGWDARPATPAELDGMRADVADAMAQGAVGLSSGLTYPPGMYADTEELVELCRVVAGLGGYYSPHHRSYGAGALDAYAEMVDVSRRSGVPLHLAHATMNFPLNAGRAGEMLALLDDAIDSGCDITLDTYPYLPGATYLSALLPSWAAEGGPSATMARLSDVDTRERIRVAMEELGSDGCYGVPIDWHWIEISGVRHPHNEHLVGHRIADSAARLGVAPIVLGHVANHRSTTRAGVTLAVYSQYTYDKEKRTALEMWAERVSGIVAPKSSADVVPIGRGVDGVAFDAGLALALASNADGTLSVVHEDTPAKFAVLENAATEPGARTLTLDPTTHLLYLPTAKFEPSPAPARGQPQTRPKPLEGSFKVLVVGR